MASNLRILSPGTLQSTNFLYTHGQPCHDMLVAEGERTRMETTQKICPTWKYRRERQIEGGEEKRGVAHRTVHHLESSLCISEKAKYQETSCAEKEVLGSRRALVHLSVLSPNCLVFGSTSQPGAQTNTPEEAGLQRSRYLHTICVLEVINLRMQEPLCGGKRMLTLLCKHPA